MAAIGALLLGGPADGQLVTLEDRQREFGFVEPPTDNLTAARARVYTIGVLTGAGLYRVGMLDQSECPIRKLLAGYRRPQAHDSDENVAEQLVTIIGGPGDGEHMMVPSYHYSRLESNGGIYEIATLYGKDGKHYRIAMPLDSKDCAIKLLIEGYRKEVEVADMEECRFCGCNVESPCDAPPPDTCEKALNAAYDKRDGGTR